MKPSQEDIFNQLASRLKKGYKTSELVFPDAENREALVSMLEVAKSLQGIPKNAVPAPIMRRKYSTVHVKESIWSAMFHFSRFAGVMASLVVVIAGVATTAYATLQSLPGQKLFTLKRSAEQLQVKFASNPNEKASLYVALSEKRLREAEIVLASNNVDPKQQMAALNELSKQTQTAVNEIQKVAQENSLGEKDAGLVNTLESLTKKQQDLVKQVAAEDGTKTLASSAIKTAQDNQSKLTEIKKSMTVAAAEKDQSLASLSPDPNTVQISGTLNQASKDKITVEKTLFYMSEKTVITDIDNKPLTFSGLTLKSKVNVVGRKDETEGRIIATQVIVVNQEQPVAETKGSATTTAATGKTASSTAPSTSKGEPTKEDPIPSPTPAASTTRGGFIIEDPSPQFVP